MRRSLVKEGCSLCVAVVNVLRGHKKRNVRTTFYDIIVSLNHHLLKRYKEKDTTSVQFGYHSILRILCGVYINLVRRVKTGMGVVR